MRLYSFVAAAVLASASFAAHADTVTQTFNVPFTPDLGNGYGGGSALPTINPFNPSAGTLNSVSYFLAGTLTIAGSPSFAPGSTPFFEGEVGNLVFQQFDVLTKDGTFNVSVGLTSADPFILQSVEGPGSPYTTADFSGQFLTGADITGTVTYNYTAVAATPEPSSLALLGTGLLGAVGMMRKRFAW